MLIMEAMGIAFDVVGIADVNTCYIIHYHWSNINDLVLCKKIVMVLI